MTSTDGETSDVDLTNIDVVVTCYGAWKDDVGLLKGGKICSLLYGINFMMTHISGMSQDKAGFPKEAFPWNGDSKTKDNPLRQLTLDLTNTIAMTSGKKVSSANKRSNSGERLP